MTDEQAERLRELEKFATPAPWQGYSEPEVGLPYSLFSGTPMQTGFGPIEPLCPRDIDLIVAMRNALPALLAERERLMGLVEAFLETREFLGMLEPFVCEWSCPTEWKTADGQPHSKLHEDFREVLFKHEAVRDAALSQLAPEKK